MTRSMMRFFLLLAVYLLASARPVLAQTPTPVTAASGFEFTDVDHAAVNADGTPVIVRYEIRFQGTSGCAAIPPVNAGKPVQGANAVIQVKPVAALGTLTANCAYTAVIAAIGPTGAEGVSATSDPFVRVVPKVPATPSKPAVLP